MNKSRIHFRVIPGLEDFFLHSNTFFHIYQIFAHRHSGQGHGFLVLHISLVILALDFGVGLTAKS